MRNLQLVRRMRSETCSPGVAQCCSVRVDTGNVLVASQYGVTELDPRTGQVLTEVSLSTEGFLPEDGTGLIVGIQDLPDQECVCVATMAGDVLLYSFATGQVECVGSVESGLRAMCWSPDQELVSLATGQETIILMTKEFEPITEVQIHQDDFGEGRLVTVGWGKKETQFHGSEGKQAAQRKPEQVQPAVPWDDRRVRISWRGDGKLFAVSAVCPDTGARRVRVWSRECVLQATSEVVSGLEQALCWKPSGSLIASTQRQPNKHSVVFMEKNGLLHGEFILTCNKEQVKVKELLWNSDSTVLAVWVEDMNAGQDGQLNTSLQLWSVGNYHWYLKQTLHFGREPQRAPVCVCWDAVQSLRLHVLTHAWISITYDWVWSTDRSIGEQQDDHAQVAVIDGDKVLVTAFRQCVIPPPMCSYELHLTLPVNHVTFCCEPQRTNQLAALTTDGRISVYSPAAQSSAHVTTTPQLQQTYSIALEPGEPLAVRLLLWLTHDTFLAVTCAGIQAMSHVLILQPSETGGSQATLEIRSCLQVEGYVISMCYNPGTGSVALQLDDGRIRKLLWDSSDLSVDPWLSSSGHFPTPCVCVALGTVDGEEHLFGLTEHSCFFMGNTEMASSVTSFIVHNNFLLLTTHTHTCRCLHLSKLSAKGLQLALSCHSGQNDETFRRVERGSRIITVVPHDTRLILQMPRGSLETIHHRALVLAQVRAWLDSLKFREAFECMRKLRINLNFIYDHNPKVFLEHVESFLKQMDSVSYLNLFLTELKEEDTTKTMYPCQSNTACPAAQEHSVKKVDVVCDALRSCMEAVDPHRYFLSILTSHVKKSVPELEVALQKVHQLREKPLVGEKVVTAEEALKYLLFLVDVNELYKHSLGTYDFHLVMMVVEKSQKDPKEYLPFLNSLKKMDLNYQRYTIDKHLKRYDKALLHLSKSGEEHFPECVTLVKEQQLYSKALKLYATDSSEYKTLSCVYAEHLLECQHAEEAGLLLWRCGETTRAMEAFISCGSWRNALSVATQVPLNSHQLSVMARDLAVKLMEMRRYMEASVLLEQYAKDWEEAISTLIKGSAWEEALRLMYTHGRGDIIETNLKPALLEAHCQQTSYLQAQRSLFKRHRSRLILVRELKDKQLQLLTNDEDVADCQDTELFSEASSVLSSKYSHSNSRISARSSKNRRKAERKKLSLKEGSPMEDVALLYALNEIIITVDKMRDELHPLLKMLVLFQFDSQAGELQKQFEELLDLLEVSIPEIWPESMQQSSVPITGPMSTVNSITAFYQQQQKCAAPSALHKDAEIFTPPKMKSGLRWKLNILSV